MSLFTIVYGLLLSELFTSFHKLIRARKIIKWNWLPLLTAWFLFLSIIKNWWNMAITENNSEKFNIIWFIIYGHLVFILYLAVSVVFPDKIQNNRINLKEYYFQHHRYLWGLIAAASLIPMLISIVTKLIHSTPLNITNIFAFIIYLSLIFVLVISKKYWVHAVLLIFFTLMTLLDIVQII